MRNNTDREISLPLYWRVKVIGTITLFAILVSGCGSQPTSLWSARDIQNASKDTERIVCPYLPLEAFPLLSKFENLKAIRFDSPDGTGATDQKLEALAKISWKNLKDINLLNCPFVTDAGIQHLSKIKSVTLLGLEGTSITDEALQIMSEMELRGVNVANCPKVTVRGLKMLAPSTTLKTFTFSANSLSGEEVISLINLFQSITWCQIVDPDRKLNTIALKELGEKKGVRIVIKTEGALQHMKRSAEKYK